MHRANCQTIVSVLRERQTYAARRLRDGNPKPLEDVAGDADGTLVEGARRMHIKSAERTGVALAVTFLLPSIPQERAHHDQGIVGR